jgi:putative ABC transport system substrate-binding protein
MRRREFIGLLGAAAVRPLAAHAQQPTMPTIGALVIGNINPEQFWREFRQGLRDLGYVEGQNIRFEFRSAEGHLDRLPELAAELVRLKVDIIVTWFTPTAVAAKQATHEIPIAGARCRSGSSSGERHCGARQYSRGTCSKGGDFDDSDRLLGRRRPDRAWTRH